MPPSRPSWRLFLASSLARRTSSRAPTIDFQPDAHQAGGVVCHLRVGVRLGIETIRGMPRTLRGSALWASTQRPPRGAKFGKSRVAGQLKGITNTLFGAIGKEEVKINWHDLPRRQQIGCVQFVHSLHTETDCSITV